MHRVFMDRVEIRGGDQWRTKIDDALQNATTVLSIIGRDWLTLKDGERLRITRKNDWVRHETREALTNGKCLIPLYVDDAKIITNAKLLPPDMRELVNCQAIRLTEEYWEAGLSKLVRRLVDEGCPPKKATIPMPERRKRVMPLTAEVLNKKLAKMPGWAITSTFSTLDGGETTIMRNELYKEYRFSSFCEATRFMAETSPEINLCQHHSRWENVWTTVRVWLSTWDIEFQPSAYDLHLAKILDDGYKRFRASTSAA